MNTDPLRNFDVALVRAPNPGPLTLSGTNSWIVGRDPAWLVDPGPALDAHLDAVAAELRRRGGVGGIAVTHSHADHAEGLAGMLTRVDAGVAIGAAFGSEQPLVDGAAFGPFVVMALPGHAADHLGFVLHGRDGIACFTGDAVLGEGSVFVAGDMAGYLDGLERLKAVGPTVLCPGHGPVVTDPATHLDAYVAHRLERERRVLAALADGVRDEDVLLTAAWGDLPARLRRPARATLAAHLAKLRAEGRHPD